MLDRLCHGGERKPLEPYGIVAPLLRAVAWGLLFVASGAWVVALVVGVLRRDPEPNALLGTLVAAGIGGALFARGLAAVVRPKPMSLTAWDVESER